MKNIFKRKYVKMDLLHKKYDQKAILSAECVDNSITYEQIQKAKKRQPNVPEGLVVKCLKCGEVIYSRQLKEEYMVCSKCGSCFRMTVEDRIKMIADEDSFVELYEVIEAANPIDFPDYNEKIKAQQKKTGYRDAVITGRCTINNIPVYIGIMNAEFMMASMGQAVGEKITRIFERATAEKLPVILFTASGGARMQEGIFSLMQMAKISAAVKRHKQAGLLYITILTHPTTGGVTASFAMEGDIILAEPKALIGFAGPRVIEQTIRQKLPDGFQTSEFLLEHGFVDAIVERKNQREYIANILMIHQCGKTFKGLIPFKVINQTIKNITDKKKIPKKKFGKNMSIWEKVQTARAQERPTALDYINIIFENFTEFHGDRYFGDDRSIVGGIGFFEGKPVTVIGQQKGRNTAENVMRNFGMPNPEGYRKALRLMKQAEKFNRPVICFIDTPGAYPGMGAEERGQGEAIAKNLMEMSDLRTPVISFIIGEGGSGGALALGVSDKVYMLENSIYSILSPEGFASILWKDGTRAREAAEVMKITAEDLLSYEIIDEIVCEPKSTAAADVETVAKNIGDFIREDLKAFETEDINSIVDKRYARFRKF